jgi:hypothetical protein
MRNRISLAGPPRPSGPSAPATMLPRLSIPAAQAAAVRRAVARGHVMEDWQRDKAEWSTRCDRCGQSLHLATGSLSAAGVAAIKAQGGVVGEMDGGVVYVLGAALEPCGTDHREED